MEMKETLITVLTRGSYVLPILILHGDALYNMSRVTREKAALLVMIGKKRI